MVILYNMINIDIAVFRKNVKKYLAVPCQVTRYGTPIASIVPTGKLATPPIPQKVEREIKKQEKAMASAAGTWEAEDQPKTFWFNGKKYLVDENGNETEVR